MKLNFSASISKKRLAFTRHFSNWERFDSPDAAKRRELLRILKESDDFVRWSSAAHELDKLEGKSSWQKLLAMFLFDYICLTFVLLGKEEWKKRDETHLYDYKLIRGQLLRLRELSTGV